MGRHLVRQRTLVRDANENEECAIFADVGCVVYTEIYVCDAAGVKPR
jgi:hypothetical protein